MSQFVPRNRYDHIALLTDLTPKTHSALSYARAFAAHFGARLTLLHALPRHGDLFTARHALEMLADALRRDGIDVHMHLHVRKKLSSIATLHRALEKLNADLIIQGTSGVDDPRRLVVGSTAESIFRSVKVPVLTVAQHVMPLMNSGLPFNRILFMTDFGVQARNAAVYALALAQEFRSRVTLFHTYGETSMPWQREEVMKIFKQTLEEYIQEPMRDWCDPEVKIAFGDVQTEVDLTIQQLKPDLILLGAYSLGPLGTRGKPGTAFRVIARADCPVLTLLDAPATTVTPPIVNARPDLMINARKEERWLRLSR